MCKITFVNVISRFVRSKVFISNVIESNEALTDPLLNGYLDKVK
jgi:hypothetical protein